MDIEGRTQIDEATHSAEEGEENTVKHDGNADVKDVACIDRLAEGWPPREHLELPETSSAVPEITENLKEKILDSTEPTEVRQVGGSLKHEEWKVVEPEKEVSVYIKTLSSGLRLQFPSLSCQFLHSTDKRLGPGMHNTRI